MDISKTARIPDCLRYYQPYKELLQIEAEEWKRS